MSPFGFLNAAALSLLMTAGICSIIMNIMDILRMRQNTPTGFAAPFSI